MEINWDELTDETVKNLSRLIQAETVNPPGNEIRAIRVIQEILQAAGVPEDVYTIVAKLPERPCLVARLKGDGSQRPLLLSGHVDVVAVDREHWTHDPFGGEVIDGEVWGRGALDMKGLLASYLAVFLLAFRQKLPLKRDLVLAAIADEEVGFTYGSKFLVDEHRELIDAEFGITESGGLTFHMGGARLYPIQTAEKAVCWLNATAHGRPGHGSMPHDENAVLRLAQALERLRRAVHLPVHLTPPVLAMLETLSKSQPFPTGTVIGLLRNPALAGVLLRRLPTEQRSLFIALLTNSVSPTILQAGAQTNVIPSSAMAKLDCRILPGQSAQDAMREIQAVMGEHIKLEVIASSTGASAPMDTPLYRLMAQATQRMDPGGYIMPTMLPGATDASMYSRTGMKMYGFSPGILPPEIPLMKMAHGHDERIPVATIRSGLPALWQVVSEFCSQG